MWEPRGPWSLALVKSLCDELALVHVVDPFVTQQVTGAPTYFRMHGISGWRHRYNDDELLTLAARVPPHGKCSVMFNNVSCIADAKRFRALFGHHAEFA